MRFVTQCGFESHSLVSFKNVIIFLVDRNHYPFSKKVLIKGSMCRNNQIHVNQTR